jgi:uncharacterized protein
MKKIILVIIKGYQKTISPDHGFFSGGKQRVCKFYPTCSEYTYQAIEAHGLIKGIGLGVWRILRCNPFTKGGHDPVKVEKTKTKIKRGKGLTYVSNNNSPTTSKYTLCYRRCPTGE